MSIVFVNCNEESLSRKAKRVYNILRRRIDEIMLSFSLEVCISLSVAEVEGSFRFELLIDFRTFQIPGEYRGVYFFNTLKRLFSDCVRFNVEYGYGCQMIAVAPKKRGNKVGLSIGGSYFENISFHLVYDC